MAASRIGFGGSLCEVPSPARSHRRNRSLVGSKEQTAKIGADVNKRWSLRFFPISGPLKNPPGPGRKWPGCLVRGWNAPLERHPELVAKINEQVGPVQSLVQSRLWVRFVSLWGGERLKGNTVPQFFFGGGSDVGTICNQCVHSRKWFVDDRIMFGRPWCLTNGADSCV